MGSGSEFGFAIRFSKLPSQRRNSITRMISENLEDILWDLPGR
jgi:hypothetical protein